MIQSFSWNLAEISEHEIDPMYFLEKLSGLKINFQKSELFCFEKAMKMENDYK
jgi:hypothetical protein